MIVTLVEKEYQNKSRDQINKTYKTCGCIFISELDIINNIINDKYIQYCQKHTITTIQSNIKRSILSRNSSRNRLTDTLESTISKANTFDKNNNLEYFLNFGRYKNKSFNYVFQNDKLYCYNLAFWKNNNCEYKNININLFIQFIKTKISINEIN